MFGCVVVWEIDMCYVICLEYLTIEERKKYTCIVRCLLCRKIIVVLCDVLLFCRTMLIRCRLV